MTGTTIGDAVRLARYFGAADALARALAAHEPGDSACRDRTGWAALLTEYNEAREAVQGRPLPGLSGAPPRPPLPPTGNLR